MRSERKRRRTFLARFMVLFMIINLLSGVNPSVLKADTAADTAHFKNYTLEQTDNATGVKLTQKASNYNNGNFDVEMTVEGNEDSTTKMHTLDVVLAIDTSNSMGLPKKWLVFDTYERLNNAKNAAKSFAEILLKKSKTNVRVAVVGFGDEAYTKAALTSNKKAINKAIDSLELTGATYTQDALKMAYRILKNGNADQKKIVLLSDGVPTYGYSNGERIGNGSEVSDQIKEALYSEADAIKRKGISITTVGIGVDATGKSILEKVAEDSGGYKAANEFGSNLDKILKDLAEEIVNKKVDNGRFVIPMADYVKFNGNLTYEVTTNGIKNENLTKAIKTTKPDPGKNLIFDGLTLGKDDKLIIKYKAELVEERKDGDYYDITNTSPELFLTSSSNDKIAFDKIMKVKDLKTVNLVINKQWVGPVPTGVDSVEFSILSNNDTLNKKAIVKKDNEWKTTVEGLPRYKDGNKIVYQLKEDIPQDATYEVSKNERSDAVNGDIIFNVTNKNTEKVDYVVTKKWGNTPSELQFATNVQLYDGENKVNNRLVTLKDNNWTATFTDLPKYNDNGDEIKYSVKEVGDKEEEKEGKLTLQGYEYSVKHDTANATNQDTITNTVTNASKKTFTATVTKKWEGGISTNDVIFTFTNTVENKKYDLKLTPKSLNGENTWTGETQLPKYNDNDNSLAEYTVTEVAVPGFTTTGGENKVVTASKPNVEFINTRKTQKITVTKDWGATPDEYIKDITVVLTGEAEGHKDIIKTMTIPVGKKSVEFTVPTHTNDGEEIKYTASEQGENNGKVIIDSKEFEVTHRGPYTIVNTYTGLTTDSINLTIIKKWEGEGRVPVVFEVKDENGEKACDNIVLNSDPWTASRELPKWDKATGKVKTYIVNEVKTPPTFDLYPFINENDNKISRVDKIVTFTNIRVMRKLELEKEWIGEAAGQARFKIEGGGVSKDITLTKNKKWKESVDLPVYDLEGNVINYAITEESNEGYKAVKPTQTFNFVDPANPIGDRSVKFTNIELLKPQFTVHKTWVGEPASNATFGLFADGESVPVDTLELTRINAKSQGSKVWEGVFTKEIPAKDINGHAIKYVVKELDAAGKPVDGEVKLGDRTFKVESTRARDTANTYNFKNTDITKTDISVTKTWLGKVPMYQLVHFGLYKVKADGLELVDNENYKLENTRTSVWTVSFKDVPAVDEKGNIIKYVIMEVFGDRPDAVNTGDTVTLGKTNYKVSYDEKGNITNTELIDKANPFTVHKTWTGKPAESVSFGLFADDNIKPEETIKLTAGNAQAVADKKDVWTGTFTKELPEYKLVNGEVKKISYVVKELNEKGEPVENEGTVKFGDRTYEVQSNSVARNNTFNFTNTDITTGEITYTKEWKGAKSDKAKFGLFVKAGNDLVKARKGNNEILAAYADTEGKITFKGVDFAKYSAENYVVRELNKEGEPVENEATIELNDTTPAGDSVVKKYQVTYDDTKKNITNTELIDITVTKTWGENVPQSEQQSVAVGVFKTTGTEPVKEIEQKEGNWTYRFENLPYVDGGYQVKETKINGVEVNNDLQKLYKVKVKNGNNIIATRDNVEITNDFNIDEVSTGKIKVVKRWTVEPKDITVSLFTKDETPAGSVWNRVDKIVVADGNNRVLEAEFDKPAEGTEYKILETAIGNVALSEDVIQSILNDENNYSTQYKIDSYDVTVHEIKANVFFIKNTNDKLLTELTVIKHWSDRTPAKYIKPVKVQLYVEEAENGLIAVGKPVELNEAGDWTYTFNGLDKKSGEDELKYHIAEVGEGKESVSLAEIKEGYKLGNYNVNIVEDSQYVSITNDVNLIDIVAKKEWVGQVAANSVDFTLYKKVGANLVEVEEKSLNKDYEWKTVFEVQGEDDNGKIEYQIFETAIDGVKINIDPTAATGYKTDEQRNISYSTGTINDGSYSVVITGNSKDNNFVVKNSFTRNPVLPVIPGGDTPGGTPVIPVVTPDPIPTPTPNPSTPVVDVPNDPSPQGPATPVNDGDEDNGVTEIDEDDVPQGDGKKVKKDNKANKDTVDITDNKAPKGTANLPKTGGEAGNFLSIIGLGLIGLGLVIRRRR